MREAAGEDADRNDRRPANDAYDDRANRIDENEYRQHSQDNDNYFHGRAPLS